MEQIDWGPLKSTIDELALQLALILIIPLVISLVLKFLLVRLVRLPNKAANFLTAAVGLFLFYKVFEIMFT
ncbi:hypothetical protein FZD47_24040 [Bacillus infantis]|uniref:Uncharacterized protein n=1 Tax=Bacillus infantis TaxID=324767 RepID=A0A5D4S411_9BACI|nr:hypothetical protein [Bacillus infantis]TYS57910.1 hypothetical protein FZD47_24040 [Bacillus infantis]